ACPILSRLVHATTAATANITTTVTVTAARVRNGTAPSGRGGAGTGFLCNPSLPGTAANDTKNCLGVALMAAHERSRRRNRLAGDRPNRHGGRCRLPR